MPIKVEDYALLTVVAIVGGLGGAMVASSLAQSQTDGPLAAIIVACVVLLAMSRSKTS